MSAYLTQREKTVRLNGSMEVAEQDTDREKDDICRIPEEVAPQLYSFAEKEGPGGQRYHGR